MSEERSEESEEVDERGPAKPLVDRPRLNRPVRALVAAFEVLVGVIAVWAAITWAWPRGVATITMVLSDGTELVSTRYFGNWMALAIAFGTIAAVLVVDALRQLLLATRTRAAKT